MIASIVSVGIIFCQIIAVIKTILFFSAIVAFMSFAFLKIGNVYADKYFLDILKYIFRKKIYIAER